MFVRSARGVCRSAGALSRSVRGFSAKVLVSVALVCSTVSGVASVLSSTVAHLWLLCGWCGVPRVVVGIDCAQHHRCARLRVRC